MYAVIDIGSNSVRLMLYKNKGVNKKILNSTTLAEKLAINGRLLPEAMQRTATAVVDFYHYAISSGADNVLVFGTEAMRAEGGLELKAMIENQIPVCVEIISGNDEAKLGFLGCSMGKNCAVIDVGGASVELIAGNNGIISYAKSLKLGVVRTRDITGDDRESIENYYRKQILSFDKVTAPTLVAIGGTATSIASMALNQTIYDSQAVHGSVVTVKNLSKLEDEVFSGVDILKRFPSLSPKRALVIPHGIVLYRLMAEYLCFDSFTVSELDNMEGFLMNKNLI